MPHERHCFKITLHMVGIVWSEKIYCNPFLTNGKTCWCISMYWELDSTNFLGTEGEYCAFHPTLPAQDSFLGRIPGQSIDACEEKVWESIWRSSVCGVCRQRHAA